MTKVTDCINDAIHDLIDIARWLLLAPLDLISKLIRFAGSMNRNFRNCMVDLLLCFENRLQNIVSYISSFIEDGLIGQVYHKIATLLSEEPASAQLNEARLGVQERFQGCEQRIRKIETRIAAIRECRCNDGIIKKGKAREPRSEDEVSEAMDECEKDAGHGEAAPVKKPWDPQAGGVQGYERCAQQALVLKKKGAAILARDKALGLEETLRKEEEARIKQALRDAEQAHYMEQAHATGRATVLEDVEDQVTGESAQAESGDDSSTGQVQFHPSVTRYERERYPAGRAHPSVYQRDPK